jgi:hypothetical protein
MNYDYYLFEYMLPINDLLIEYIAYGIITALALSVFRKVS